LQRRFRLHRGARTTDGRAVFVEIAPGRVVAIVNVHLPLSPYSPFKVQNGADELADAFEAYEPNSEDERKASSLMALRLAAIRGADADRVLLEAVADARRHHTSWAAIGAVLGTSGEAARQRYGELVNH
jgi:hypothetical protein